MTEPLLRPADVTAEADSFHFYGLLPGDPYELSADWPSLDLGAEARSAQRDLADTAALDRVTLALLAHRAAPLPDGLDWQGLADACTRSYARQLQPDGRRALRMRLGRVNFMLRALLDLERADDAAILTERRLEQRFPWDWLPLPEGELVAASQELNLHYMRAGQTPVAMRLGLPTQLDALADGRVAIGSCYSDGWQAWGGKAPEVFTRPRPVVLVFEQDGERYELDADGAVRRSGNTEMWAQMPLRAVWRARRLGSRVVAADWGEAGSLAVLDLDTWRCGKIGTGPVLITNDICELDGRYYLIDKMQGRVFAFDLDFSPLGARMHFGKGYGKLYDPISIRVHQGNLHVLSWITSSLVTIRPF